MIRVGTPPAKSSPRIVSSIRGQPTRRLAGCFRMRSTSNCDLPSVQRALEDPELFFEGIAPGAVVVFDEVHRLADPSRLLKIVADGIPADPGPGHRLLDPGRTFLQGEVMICDGGRAQVTAASYRIPD